MPSLQIRVHNLNLIVLFLNQNNVLGTQKNCLSGDSSFEHPKPNMLKRMNKKTKTILGKDFCLCQETKSDNWKFNGIIHLKVYLLRNFI